MVAHPSTSLLAAMGAGKEEAPPRTLVTALWSPCQMFLEPFPRLDCQTAPRQAEGLATRQDTSHNKGSNHRATAASKGIEGPGLAGGGHPILAEAEGRQH